MHLKMHHSIIDGIVDVNKLLCSETIYPYRCLSSLHEMGHKINFHCQINSHGHLLCCHHFMWHQIYTFTVIGSDWYRAATSPDPIAVLVNLEIAISSSDFFFRIKSRLVEPFSQWHILMEQSLVDRHDIISWKTPCFFNSAIWTLWKTKLKYLCFQ